MTKVIPAAAALAAALLVAAPACKHKVHSSDTIEEARHKASLIRMATPSTADQLVSGFYGLEAGAWRWTARKFAVNLHPPAHSAQRGATLEVHFTLPDTSVSKLRSVTLSAAIGGTALPPETYSTAGAFVYRRDIPENLLTADMVGVDFELDKAVPPEGADKRELGLVVASVGLVAK